MNSRGRRQRFLPLPDLSMKIEGDSVRRVLMRLHSTFFQGEFALDQEEQLPYPKLFRDF